MNMLDEYFKLIENVRQLSNEEFHELVIRINNENDKEKRKKLINDAFLGSLSLLLNRLKNNDLDIIKNSVIDEIDFINSAIMVWYYYIDSDFYMDKDVNYYVFNINFYNKLYSFLINNYNTMHSNLFGIVNYNDLDVFFYDYMLINNSEFVLYNDYINFIKNRINTDKLYKKQFLENNNINYNKILYIYNILVNIQKNFPNAKACSIKLYEKTLLTDCEYGKNKDNKSYEIESDILDREEDKTLFDTVMKSNMLSEIEKEVLLYRFGFYNNKEYTFENIGIKLGYCKERIRQIYKDALIKIRKDVKVKYFFESNLKRSNYNFSKLNKLDSLNLSKRTINFLNRNELITVEDFTKNSLNYYFNKFFGVGLGKRAFLEIIDAFNKENINYILYKEDEELNYEFKKLLYSIGYCNKSLLNKNDIDNLELSFEVVKDLKKCNIKTISDFKKVSLNDISKTGIISVSTLSKIIKILEEKGIEYLMIDEDDKMTERLKCALSSVSYEKNNTLTLNN